MSARCLRLILTAAALASLNSAGAWARGLPDWADAVAAAAPTPPEGLSKHTGRVLYSEVWNRVEKDGSIWIRKRRAAQALTTASDEVGFLGFPLASTAKMTTNRVWHVPPGKSGRREMALPVTVNLEDSFLGGTRVRAMGIDGLRKGSLVFFEFEARDKPYIVSPRHLFYEGAPVDVARYGIEVPEGWTVQHEWLRGHGQEPVREGQAYVWEMRDIRPPDDEPLAPEGLDEAPLLALSIVPPPGSVTVGATFTDWASFGRWYSELIRGLEEPTDPIRKAATEIGAEGMDFAETVRRAGLMVRDRVRYVAVELGIGGLQPRPAGDTFANLYGDCKDKGTLFRSLLSLRGIRSYPVLVNLTVKDTVPSRVPSWGFDHFVVAVAIPAGADVPEALRAAVVDAGELGRLLIVDTTDDRVAIGSMSAGLSGKRALVIVGEDGRLITLPGTRMEDHLLLRRFSAELMPDRSLRIRRSSSHLGEFAVITRSAYRGSAGDRRKSVEAMITSIWPDAIVEDYTAEQETPEGAFEETIALLRRPLLASGPAAHVALFPGVEADVARVPLTKRSVAVDYTFPRRIEYQVSYRGLPSEAPLPAPQSAEGDGWSVRSSSERRGEEVTATLRIDLSRTRFEAAAFPELRKFWSAVAVASARSVPLTAEAPR